MATGLEYEATELRLGLPGGGDGEGRNASAKRGFADTIDLKLKLEPAAAAVEEEEEEAGDNREEIVAAAAAEEEEEESSAGKMKRSPSQSSAVVTEKPRAPKAQVVGWPPVRSFRKNIMSVQAEKGSKYKSSSSAAAFVKVSLDGAPYLRKVDLRMYESYQDLSKALDTMFSSFTITGSCGSQGMNGMNESKLVDQLLNGSEYVPTYEDKDGTFLHAISSNRAGASAS